MKFFKIKLNIKSKKKKNNKKYRYNHILKK